jgi:pantoate--beta-alanine ligase
VALVPTMGALHAGHIALVKAARRRARRVAVSIFVNPTQFAPTEDFGSYPRNFAADIAALKAEKADLVWAPSAATMYPEGFATRIEPAGAAKAGLEDKFRPHFFGGVATVVAKLFTQVAPDFALFGEKDYQQLRVITQMAKDLDLPVKIIGVPTVREKDGLALSSRNVYLTAEERAVAPVLHRVLKESARRIGQNEEIARVLDDGRKEISRAGFALDYLEARHALTLAPIASREEGPIRLLVAAKIGKTRLIDNIGV